MTVLLKNADEEGLTVSEQVMKNNRALTKKISRQFKVERQEQKKDGGNILATAVAMVNKATESITK